MARAKLKRLRLNEPSTKGSDGRDPATGRFLPGWKGGPGNPHAKRSAQLRSAFVEGVSRKHLDQIVAMLLRRALQGERWAVEVLLDRTLGKAATLEQLIVQRVGDVEREPDLKYL